MYKIENLKKASEFETKRLSQSSGDWKQSTKVAAKVKKETIEKAIWWSFKNQNHPIEK